MYETDLIRQSGSEEPLPPFDEWKFEYEVSKRMVNKRWGPIGDESCHFDQDGNQTEPYSNGESPYKSRLQLTLEDGNQIAMFPHTKHI